MEIHKFKNYEEYKSVQIVGYDAKVNTHTWVDTNSVGGLVNYIYNYNPNASFGLCHGTRRGVEQQSFIDCFKILNRDVTVIGTEIAADASTRFPHTIEWDFHNVKDEWIKSVDFIYSNAFDHSYQPSVCLDAWMSCLSDMGVCIIEWNSDCDNNSRPMDPFAASIDEYKELISAKYEILDILESNPDESKGTLNISKRYFFIIKNKNI